MSSGYSYFNENGKLVSGRAADNHWMSEHGYLRVADLIDDVAKQVANQIKAELNQTVINKSIIKMTKK